MTIGIREGIEGRIAVREDTKEHNSYMHVRDSHKCTLALGI